MKFYIFFIVSKHQTILQKIESNQNSNAIFPYYLVLGSKHPLKKITKQTKTNAVSIQFVRSISSFKYEKCRKRNFFA